MIEAILLGASLSVIILVTIFVATYFVKRHMKNRD